MMLSYYFLLFSTPSGTYIIIYHFRFSKPCICFLYGFFLKNKKFLVNTLRFEKYSHYMFSNNFRSLSLFCKGNDDDEAFVLCPHRNVHLTVLTDGSFSNRKAGDKISSYSVILFFFLFAYLSNISNQFFMEEHKTKHQI